MKERIQINFRFTFDESDLEEHCNLVMRCGGKIIVSFLEDKEIGVVIADVKNKKEFYSILVNHIDHSDFSID